MVAQGSGERLSVCILRASRIKGEAGLVSLGQSSGGRLRGSINKRTDHLFPTFPSLILYLGLIHHSLTPAVFIYTSIECIQIRFKHNPADL